MEAIKAFNNELSSLYESKPPISKAKMTQLTRTAIKGIKFYKHVVQSVEKFIQKCRPEYKVPGLYVIDSIVRQSRHQFGIDKDLFVPRFSKNIVNTFQFLYKCPPEEKPRIVKVLNLWQKNNVFATDLIQPLLDMAHMEASGNILDSKLPKSSGDDNSWKSWNAPSQATDTSSGLLQPVRKSAHNKEGDDEPAALDSSIFSQLQELTSQLLTKDDHNRPKDETPAVKFNKKLLDFDYGDEEEEPDDDDKEENGHGTTGEPTALALSMAQNLLSNPELLHQLQQMQQTIQMTEALKNEMTVHEPSSQEKNQVQNIHLQNSQQQQSSQSESNYGQHLNIQSGFNDPVYPAMNRNEIPVMNSQHMQMLNSSVTGGYHMSPSVYPPPQQAFPPPHGMLIPPPNMSIEGEYPLNLHGLVGTHMDIELPRVDSTILMHDRDERQAWAAHLKDADERERLKNEKSRSRSRSPRNRSKSSRRHRRSRSRSPRRKRSTSHSPSRHRREKRSDSKDWEKDRESEKEKEREKERERRRLGLPILKKNFLAVCSTTLWLGHVPKMVVEVELKETFTDYGAVSSIDLIPPRGCAYICMERRQDAAKALQRLKNLKLQGSSIKMAWAPGKGMKGKEYKEHWDAEQGVTFIPYENLPDKSKIPDLAEGGMIDEESLPENMKAMKPGELEKGVKMDKANVSKDIESKPIITPVVQKQLPQITTQQQQVAAQQQQVVAQQREAQQQAHQQAQQQAHQQAQVQQQVQDAVARAMANNEQANLLAGAPIHLPVMPPMPQMSSLSSQFGLSIQNMSQAMLLPQIPLPMGVPPPNQIMMMSNHSAMMNPPPSIAVLNAMSSTLSGLQQTHLTQRPPTAAIPNLKDPDQMDENSDATPTDEDNLRSSGMDIVTSESSIMGMPTTTSSLPTNFPSNPPTNMPMGFPPGFQLPGNLNQLSNAMNSSQNLQLGMPHQWPPNTSNGPPVFARPPGLGMQPFVGSMPPQMMNQNRMPMFTQGVNGPNPMMNRSMLPPNTSAGYGPIPSPNNKQINSMEMSTVKQGRHHPLLDDFDSKISANSVPLGRPRGNFGNQSPPPSPMGNVPGLPPQRSLNQDLRGPIPRIPGQNSMRPPHPQEMGFRQQGPMMPNYGPIGPRPGNRFPFPGGRLEGPMSTRPFLMRGGPPGMGMHPRGMDFHGPPPDREDHYGPDWADRRPPPFGPPRDPYFDDDHDREFSRGRWDGDPDDIRGRRRPPDDNFGKRGWQDMDEPHRFGPLRDDEPPFGPPRDGEPRFGPPRDGESSRFGPPRDGELPRFGPGRDGELPRFGPPRDVEARFGPPRDVESRFGPPRDGEPPHFGPPRDGEPPHFGPPRDGEPPHFGPPREDDRDFRHRDGFDDRRRGGRDRGFDFNRDRGRSFDRDHDRDNRYSRPDNPDEMNDIRESDRDRSHGRDRSERRSRRESRWNRSRSPSRENTVTNSANNGEVSNHKATNSNDTQRLKSEKDLQNLDTKQSASFKEEHTDSEIEILEIKTRSNNEPAIIINLEPENETDSKPKTEIAFDSKTDSQLKTDPPRIDFEPAALIAFDSDFKTESTQISFEPVPVIGFDSDVKTDSGGNVYQPTDSGGSVYEPTGSDENVYEPTDSGGNVYEPIVYKEMDSKIELEPMIKDDDCVNMEESTVVTDNSNNQVSNES